MILSNASNQWSFRPAEERYWTVEEGLNAARSKRERSKTASIPRLSQLSIDCDESGNPVLVGQAGNKASFSHFAFDQFSRRLNAPAGFLRLLPGNLVRDVLNERLKQADETDAKLLFRVCDDESLQLQCATSDSYGRIWDSDIMERMQSLVSEGWRVPPGRVPNGYSGETRIATENDVIRTAHTGLGIKVGDKIAPSGVYVSDRDCFCFLVDDNKTIDHGGTVPLARGFFVENSEVGDRALKITMFLYDSVCGNHIVWNASDVKKVKVIHRVNANDKFSDEYQVMLTAYANSSGRETEAKIRELKTITIADTKESLIDKLFGKKLLTRAQLEASYDAAVLDRDQFHPGNDPLTIWGFAQGITLASQQAEFTADRVALDKAAGKLMEMAF